MSRPKLGEFRELTGFIQKQKTFVGNARQTTKWVDQDKQQIGMYAGWRMLSEGETEYFYEADDNAPIYTPKTHFVAWMFIVNERKAPVFCTPEQVKNA